MRRVLAAAPTVFSFRLLSYLDFGLRTLDDQRDPQQKTGIIPVDLVNSVPIKDLQRHFEPLASLRQPPVVDDFTH